MTIHLANSSFIQPFKQGLASFTVTAFDFTHSSNCSLLALCSALLLIVLESLYVRTFGNSVNARPDISYTLIVLG
jgi:hypothetical protein